MRNERSQAEMYLAIQAFAELLRAERLVEKKRLALNIAAARVPDEDRSEYVETTERMAREAEAKVDPRAYFEATERQPATT